MGGRYNVMRVSALEAKGRDWRNAIIAFEAARMVAPWLALAAVLGGLGWLLHLGWTAVTGAADTADATLPVAAANAGSAVPGWLWIAVAALIAVTVWLYRPGRIVVGRARRLRLVMTFGVVLLFAGLAGVALSTITA